MESLGQCPVCSGRALALVLKTQDYFSRLEGEFTVWGCKTCGTHFLDPRPTGEELQRFYQADYYSYQPPAGPKRSKAARLLRLVFNPLRTWNIAWDRFNKGNAWARTVPRGVTGAILDIGCGGGAFLAHSRGFNPGARLVGCDPFGPEAPPAFAENRMEYRRQSIFDCAFRDGEFEFVTSSHTLEHMPDPRRSLREIARILAPGGKLFAAVPNVESFARALFGPHWSGWDAPRHLVDFSAASLAALLESEGFRVESTRHLGNAYHVVDSLTYRALGKAERPWWWRPGGLAQELTAAVANPLVKVANALSRGDGIEITAVRSGPAT